MKLPPGVTLDDPAIVEAEKRRLSADPAQTPQHIERNPEDGWVLAEPWPMSSSARTSLRAVIRAVLPPPPAPQVAAAVDLIEEAIRRMMRYLQPSGAFGLALLFRIIDWAPVWRLKSWRRMRSLPPERASQVLQGLERSRFGLLRDLAFVGRAMVHSFFYDLDEVHRAVGYEPAAHLANRVALRARLAAGAPPSEADRLAPALPQPLRAP